MISPGQQAKFIYRKKAALIHYRKPYDEDHPVVYFDETTKHFVRY